MPEKDELKYTAKDIPSIIENMTENTETTGNAVPGTEVTQTPGLIPETPSAIPGYDPNTATAPGEYAAAVDNLVESMPPSEMPVSDAAEEAHSQMMADPAYAIATHEHQLNKIANMLEELCSRVISIEAKIMQHEAEHDAAHGPDPNNPMADYPEVVAHQNRT